MNLKNFVILILILGLTFAAGGGSPNPLLKNMKLNYSYECSENKISISITDNSAATPVQNALIEIYNGTMRKTSGESNLLGRFEIKIPEGRYRIETSANGYSSITSFANIEKCKIEQESYLCEEKQTPKERIKCVLNLADEEVRKVNFVPEDCRAKDETGKKKCIKWYRLFQSCRDELESDKERENCIKPKLNLSTKLEDEVTKCRLLSHNDRLRECLDDLKARALLLVKFRMYNLEYKAYEMREKRLISEDEEVELVEMIKEHKIRFDNVGSISEKKQTVNQLKQEWEGFIATKFNR